ncbi:MAG: HAD hydrolase family protein [Planctomycetes bacterium]|nr:HAD hydrolase family protein [Planctomycetota bacterium]
MQVVVSDFDGTLYTRHQLIGDVIPAVDAWRRAGNRFGIATGRDLNMIHDGLRRTGLAVDFIICLNGAYAVGMDGTILHKTLLDDDLVPALVRHPAAAVSTHIQLSGEFLTKAVLRKDSWFTKIGIEFESISEDEAVRATGLGQMSLAFHTDDEALAWKDRLVADFPGRLAVHPNRISIDINAHGVDKANGVDRLREAMGWVDVPVRVIGDGLNDVGMIRRFGGFSLDDAPETVRAAATKVYPDVPAMLAEYMVH